MGLGFGQYGKRRTRTEITDRSQTVELGPQNTENGERERRTDRYQTVELGPQNTENGERERRTDRSQSGAGIERSSTRIKRSTPVERSVSCIDHTPPRLDFACERSV